MRAGVEGGSTHGSEGLVRTMIKPLITARYILADLTKFRSAAYLAETYRQQRTLATEQIALQRRGKWTASSREDAEKLRRRPHELTALRNDLKADYGEAVLSWPSL